jgi:addiction module RelE/StbE family toxin
VRRAVIQSSAFVRAAKRFVKNRPDAITSIRESLTQLEADAFDPRLRTHKLKGDMAGCWSCSAAYDLRIVFQFISHENAEAIYVMSVGTHDGVY